MDGLLLIVVLFQGFVMWNQVPKKYDIRKFFDKPYCEEQQLGPEKIKKCWKVVPSEEKPQDSR